MSLTTKGMVYKTVVRPVGSTVVWGGDMDSIEGRHTKRGWMSQKYESYDGIARMRGDVDMN